MKYTFVNNLNKFIFEQVFTSLYPANIRLDEDFLKTSFVFVFKTSSRHLDQDEYSRLTHTSSEDVLIKTNIFVLAISLQNVFKTSCQDVFKTSYKNVFKISSRRLQDIFKTSSRRLQDVFKTYSRHLAKTSSRLLQNFFNTSCKKRLQDVFKMSYKDVFKTFSRRIIRLNCLPRSRTCLGHTSEKFMISVENLQVW